MSTYIIKIETFIEFSRGVIECTGILPLIVGGAAIIMGGWALFEIWSGIQEQRLRDAHKPIIER